MSGGVGAADGWAVLAVLLMAAAVIVLPTSVRLRVARLRRRDRGEAACAPVDAGNGPDVSPAVLMELVAACLDCGLSPQGAVTAAVVVAGDATGRRLGPCLGAWNLGADVAVAWRGVPAPYEPLARSLVLADRTGASAAVVLRRVAGDERARRRRRARLAARRLGVRLVVPLGLTTLPAFVLWAVVPVVVGLAGQLLGSSG